MHRSYVTEFVKGKEHNRKQTFQKYISLTLNSPA